MGEDVTGKPYIFLGNYTKASGGTTVNYKGEDLGNSFPWRNKKGHPV